MFNFKDIHALFRNRSAVVTVTNGAELTAETLRLFADDPGLYQSAQEHDET